MKIQQISNFSHKTIIANKISNFNINFTNNCKNDEFIKENPNTQKPEKSSFFDKIKSLFKYSATAEEELNEEIDFIVSSILQESKKIDKLIKPHYSLAKNLVIIGQEENWQQYCDSNRARREKIIFGKIDEEKNMPESLSVISMNNNFKTMRSYEFIDGLNEFRAKDYSIPDNEDDILIKNKKYVTYQETNKNNQITQKFTKTKDGLYYYEAEIDKNNKIKQIYTVLNYDAKTYENNEYVRFNGEEFEIYHLNAQSGLWEKTAAAEEFVINE